MSGSISPLPWTGNKGCIYTTIDAFMPSHKTYVEPCMGSAEVFLRKKPSEREIINDYNGDLVKFFRVLQRSEKLAYLIGRLYFSFNSEELFRANKALLSDVENILDDITETAITVENAHWHDIELAVAFFENQTFSFSSTGKTFAIAKKDMTRKFGRLVAACSRLRNAIIMHRDYKDCINYAAGKNTFILLADENGGALKDRVMFYMDEFGTLPPISSVEMMYSASRSRRLSLVSIIQSFQQLEKNYGKEGAAIIQDNCQITIAGGFAPTSETADIISKALGSRTVMTGSVSRSKNDPSQSLQMTNRPLMTADELKSMKKGNFIVMKTGTHPFISKLKLFFKWGIEFNTEKYVIADKGARKVSYASKECIEDKILERFPYVKAVAHNTNKGIKGNLLLSEKEFTQSQEQVCQIRTD